MIKKEGSVATGIVNALMIEGIILLNILTIWEVYTWTLIS